MHAYEKLPEAEKEKIRGILFYDGKVFHFVGGLP